MADLLFGGAAARCLCSSTPLALIPAHICWACDQFFFPPLKHTDNWLKRFNENQSELISVRYSSSSGFRCRSYGFPNVAVLRAASGSLLGPGTGFLRLTPSTARLMIVGWPGIMNQLVISQLEYYRKIIPPFLPPFPWKSVHCCGHT